VTQKIGLPHGLFALVDDEDYVKLSKHKWCCSSTGYAVRNLSRKNARIGVSRSVYMHRAIMLPAGDERVDHANGNTLDNRRSNLRCCTQSENIAHRLHAARSSSGYFGVVWLRGKWQAQIRVRGRQIHLGRFSDPVEAAIARDKVALRSFGEFARLNFPETQDADN
jgi:hypothetical protein